MHLWESLAFEKVKKCVTKAAFFVVLNVSYCLLFDRYLGRGCQPRPSKGAYFII